MSRRRGLGVITLLLTMVASGCLGTTSTSEETAPAPGKDHTTAPGTATAEPAPSHAAAADGAHPLGLKWNWSQDATFDYATATGGGATFTEVEWCVVEPEPGRRDWTRTDEIVRRSAELGHELMLKIRTGQCWATRPPEPGTPDRTEVSRKTPSTFPLDPEAYRGFVTDLVDRYAASGVHVYAVENEPDVYNFWAGTIQEYEELVRLAAPVIREADPQARVLDAGLSSTAYGVLVAQRMQEDGEDAGALLAYQAYYGRRISGGASRWPAVSDPASLARVLASAPATRAAEVLAATRRLAADRVVDGVQLHFYEPTIHLPAVLALLHEELGRIEVEAWEVGVAWPGDEYEPVQAAAETARLVVLLLAAEVTRVVYLPLAYTPGNEPQVFRGLIEESGELLPAGRTYELLVELLRSADSGPRPVDPATGLSGVVMDDGADGQAAVVWAADDSVPLVARESETVTDHLGQPRPPDAAIGSDPVVVRSADRSLDRLVAAARE